MQCTKRGHPAAITSWQSLKAIHGKLAPIWALHDEKIAEAVFLDVSTVSLFPGALHQKEPGFFALYSAQMYTWFVVSDLIWPLEVARLYLPSLAGRRECCHRETGRTPRRGLPRGAARSWGGQSVTWGSVRTGQEQSAAGWILAGTGWFGLGVRMYL